MDWLIEIRLSDKEADVDAVYAEVEDLLFNLGQVGTLSVRADTDERSDSC